MNIKPSLAENANLDLVLFPCWVQPKVDGVRGMNLKGTFTGRSLDPFKGFGITDYFSHDSFKGLDGEMTLGSDAASPNRLCSLTTGAMGKFKGVTEMPDMHWWVFDLLTPDTIGLCYAHRYKLLEFAVTSLAHPRVRLMPYRVCNDRAELDAAIAEYAESGYEGTIIRNPLALYKEGRATQAVQELWRVKPWGDFEILVTGITEGQKNGNEAKTNTLGRTERSSAKAGQIPNGQVGSIQGTMVADYFSPLTGKLLFAKGLPVTAGSGKMTAKEAKAYFEDPTLIVGHFAKIKTMVHGVKDLPRFPTYESHRLPEDMS